MSMAAMANGIDSQSLSQQYWEQVKVWKATGNWSEMSDEERLRAANASQVPRQ